VVTGTFGRMALTIENAPLPENPRSSMMTALSLVRLIENRAAPVAV
jgi:aspartate dehydrogenase